MGSWSGLGDAGKIFDPAGIFVGSDDPAYYESSKLTYDQQHMFESLVKWYDKFTGGTPTYSGQRVSDLTGTQNNVLGQMSGYTLPDYSKSLNTLSSLMSGSNVNPELYNNYFKENVETPLLNTFKESALPSLQGSMNKKGLLYGTGREENEQNLAGTLMQTLAQSKTNLALQMDEANKNRALNAATSYASVGGQSISDLLNLNNMGTTGVAGQEYANKQQLLTNAYNDWLSQQPGSRPQDAMLLSLLGLDTKNVIVPGGNSGNGGLLSNLVGSILG
jgi:hypothetical protein